ncbi:MAG: hypothetical protein C0623_05215 [Desulfuromonas sp.]|nr:MAG: hypothetical protein C0623_05215 [Desulfuromonas sp.]
MAEKICQYYLDCDFFKRFNPDLSSKDKVTAFHEIVDVYCFGKLRTKCYRYIYREASGRPLEEEIAPNGKRYSIVPKAKLS